MQLQYKNNGEGWQIKKPPTVDDLEKAMLKMPQVDCPVTHHFGGGLYIREAFMPAGSVVIGHSHKKPTMNIMIKGKLLLITEDGSKKELIAPQTFMGIAGRKAAYIIEDTIWQNVHITDETDIEKLEDMFIDKSTAWIENSELKKLIKSGEEVKPCLT